MLSISSLALRFSHFKSKCVLSEHACLKLGGNLAFGDWTLLKNNYWMKHQLGGINKTTCSLKSYMRGPHQKVVSFVYYGNLRGWGDKKAR